MAEIKTVNQEHLDDFIAKFEFIAKFANKTITDKTKENTPNGNAYDFNLIPIALRLGRISDLISGRTDIEFWELESIRHEINAIMRDCADSDWQLVWCKNEEEDDED